MSNPIDLPKGEPIQYQPDTRPTLSHAELEKQYPGYFHGSVNGQIEHWKRRALVAEAKLKELENKK